MTDRPPAFRLASDLQRQLATAAVWRAPEGWYVRIVPPSRSLDQNAKIHALLSDIVKSGFKWHGETLDLDAWKALTLVGVLHSLYGESAHPAMVPGIDGGPVQIRRSSTTLTVSEGSTYIEYLTAFCITNGIKLREAA